MSKDIDTLINFLDDAGPKVFEAMKSTDKVNFTMVMDKVFEDFMNLDLGPKPRARTAKPKRKVRRGIGSY